MDIYKRINAIKKKIELKGLKLNPPIQENELIYFENQYNVKFPEEYRCFSLHLGNGGDGPPYYKLLDLQSSVKLSLDFANDEDFLAKEFPLENYLMWEGLELPQHDIEKRNKMHMGNLILGEDGCAIYWSLIVSGTQKGQIWQFTEVGVQPCAPKLTFLDWYEYWLNGRDDWWRDFNL